jgi:hypothetical protein
MAFERREAVTTYRIVRAEMKADSPCIKGPDQTHQPGLKMIASN